MSTTVLPYTPFPFLHGPHVQTILASRFSFGPSPPSTRGIVELADGDRIALEISTPKSWREPDPTVILVHGLCGCHMSAYMVRVARKLWRQGVRAVRMNLRGCGSGRGLARKLYHSGRSDDVRAVVDTLREETPATPLSLVGFSLGGNLALKLAGEMEEEAAGCLERVVAVCPPVDLLTCSRRFALPLNRVYERYFVKLLRRDVADRHRRFPELGRVDLPTRMSLFDFDDVYTAPRSGFRDAVDYYTRSSSRPLVPRIRIPCHILFAADDPLVDATLLEDVELPPKVLVTRTRRGGHLGFLGLPGTAGGYRWMDSQLLAWLGTR